MRKKKNSITDRRWRAHALTNTVDKVNGYFHFLWSIYYFIKYQNLLPLQNSKASFQKSWLYEMIIVDKDKAAIIFYPTGDK